MKDVSTSADNITHWGLGAAVPFGDITLKANYLNVEAEASDGAEQWDESSIGIGVDWKWNEKNTLTVAYYDTEDDVTDGNEQKSLVVSKDWMIRPDTTMYITAALVAAPPGGLYPVDEKTFFLNVGLNYAF